MMELLTTEELAKRLRINPETVYRWRRNGLIKSEVDLPIRWDWEKVVKQLQRAKNTAKRKRPAKSIDTPVKDRGCLPE